MNRSMLLICARRLYEGEELTVKSIETRTRCSRRAAREAMKLLRMYLPVRAVDGDKGRGHAERIRIKGRRKCS